LTLNLEDLRIWEQAMANHQKPKEEPLFVFLANLNVLASQEFIKVSLDKVLKKFQMAWSGSSRASSILFGY